MTLIFNKPLILGKEEVYNPEVFTVVGNPFITDEGIASNFSAENYLQKQISVNNNITCVIYLPFSTSNNISTTQRIYYFDTPAKAITINNSQLALSWEDINSISISTGWKNGVISANKSYIAKLEDDGENQTWSIKETWATSWNVLYIKEKIADIALNGVFTIGKSLAVNQPFLGEIDLKGVKIKINNEEVFKGTKLVIPEWKIQPFKFDVKKLERI